jgi:hypothetical protein
VIWLAAAWAASPIAPVHSVDLATDDGGWVASGDTLQWAWSAAPAAGPGGGSWGTNPDGNYLHDADDAVRASLPGLGGSPRVTLRVEHAYDVVSGDQAWLEIDAGAGWQAAAPIGGWPHPDGFVGDSGGWVVDHVDLSGLGDVTAVRFRLIADPSQAASGWYVRRLDLYDADIVAPRLSPLILPSDNQDLDGPYVVQLSVDDPAGVVDAALHWSTDTDAGSVPLVDVGNGVLEGLIEGQPAGSVVEWHAEVDDGALVGRYPEEGTASFRVFLAAPTGLQAHLDGARVATDVALTWTPPVSPHPVRGYLVSEEGGLTLEAPLPALSWPLSADGTGRLSVVADYGSLGIGDASPPLSLAVEVPELTSLLPAEGAAGQQLYVDLSGEGLYLSPESTVVSMGEGIEVLSVEVGDVQQARLLLEIEPGAAPGPRDLYVAGAQGEAWFDEAFEVLGADRLPTVRSVEPGTLMQGDSAIVVVTVSEPFAGPVVVDPGDGVVVTEPAVVDGTELRVGLAALGDAPTGERTLLLDDGRRLWPAPLVVSPYRSSVQRSCAQTGAGGAWWLAVGLLLARRRRGAR